MTQVQDVANTQNEAEFGVMPVWAVVAASVTAIAFFLILWLETRFIGKEERLQLIDLTDSFVSVFSDTRTAEIGQYRTTNPTGSHDENSARTEALLTGGIPGAAEQLAGVACDVGRGGKCTFEGRCVAGGTCTNRRRLCCYFLLLLQL